MSYYSYYKRKTDRKRPEFGIIKCKGCEVEIQKRAWNHNLCRECIAQKYREKSRKKYGEYGQEVSCEVCKKIFKRYKGKVCSKRCRDQLFRDNRIGENNPSYRNGFYTKVADKRITKSREKEFQRNAKIIRDNQIKSEGYSYCENCLTNQTLRWETHHIIWRSSIPGHPNLHNLKNLIRVCIKCHNWFHAQKNHRDKIVIERKLWELFPEHLQGYIN